MSKNIQTKVLAVVFLGVIILVSYQFWQNSKNKNQDNLKIGFITDAHFNAEKNKKTGGWKLQWRSREAMEEFVKKMNNDFKPDLVVENGDLIDGKDKRSYQTWQEADKMMQKLQAPFYHVLGNHETNSFKKSKWLELTGYNSTYYYKDINKKNAQYRVIVLDGNFLPDDSDTTPDKHYYPGHISKKQWSWLEETLEDANRQNREVIVFVHQPPVTTDFFLNWGVFPQGPKLHELFKKHRVRATFSGHIENLCNIKDGETKYFVLQGFWKGKNYLKKEYRFKDAGAFYEITVSAKDINVVMEHRVFDENIKKGNHLDKLKGWFALDVTSKYNCQDGEQLVKSEEETKIEKMPVEFFKSNLQELSGITFLGEFAYLVSDDQSIIKMSGEEVVHKVEGAVPDAEGITNDGKFLYVVSELENSIYKFNKELQFQGKKKFNIEHDGDVNIGLEGIAHYKDNLFFVVHQGKDIESNIFLVNFKTGEIVKKHKIKQTDLAGAFFYEDKLCVISASSQKILWLNKNSLEILSTEDTDDKTIEGVALKNGIIYLVSDNEEILRKNGKL
jgi:predicted MPP superfamily phosphohydrolase/uncharacterized protein YjiK